VETGRAGVGGRELSAVRSAWERGLTEPAPSPARSGVSERRAPDHPPPGSPECHTFPTHPRDHGFTENLAPGPVVGHPARVGETDSPPAGGGTGAVARPSGIGHVRLTVTDVYRSRAFYLWLLGADALRTDFSHLWADPALRDEPDRVYGGCSFAVGRQVLGLRPVASAGDRFDPDRVGLDHLALTVVTRAELEAAAGRLAAAGVEHGEVTDLPDFRVTILSVQDPDGIDLELSAPLEP